MAKNMNSSVFRKIDVDQINDEFKEDDNQLDANAQGNFCAIKFYYFGILIHFKF